jgi:hypothetical protein
MTKTIVTLIGLIVVSFALLFGQVPATTIHFPGIVPLTMLACVVLLLAVGGLGRKRRQL